MTQTAAQLDQFDVTVTGAWTEDVINRRGKVTRQIHHEMTHVVHIPMARLADAPVAMKVGEISEYRLFDGNLYLPYGPIETVCGGPGFPGEHALGVYNESAEEFIEFAEHWARTFLILDGVVYARAREPRYEVTTFGMGHNHGGTALMTSTDAAGFIFRADDFESAKRYAEMIATNRGDTESLPRFRPLIEVLIPEAVTLVTEPPLTTEQEDLQWEYRRAASRFRDIVDGRYRGDEQDAFDTMVAARNRLIAEGIPLTPYRKDAYEARDSEPERWF